MQGGAAGAEKGSTKRRRTGEKHKKIVKVMGDRASWGLFFLGDFFRDP